MLYLCRQSIRFQESWLTVSEYFILRKHYSANVRRDNRALPEEEIGKPFRSTLYFKERSGKSCYNSEST